jgi:glycosyltransferase involved in cell wall biosynthesis
MISAIIITKNAEKHLKRCLESLNNFEEIIVLDNGSTDTTLTIAAGFANVKIFHSPFIGFGPLKNLAATYAKNDWLFSIDADEIPDNELIQKILTKNWKENEVGVIYRLNYYKNVPIETAGYGNDWVTRIYNRKITQFTDAQVHEGIMDKNLIPIKLAGQLPHFSSDSIEELLQKMQHYSTLFANIHYKKKFPSWRSIYFRAFWTFIKTYFIQRGVFSGYVGFLLSATAACTTFYKYMKLYEKNKN